MNNWITDSQDEQCIEDLFRDADQIHIPIFQRPYVWKQKEFDFLIHDLQLIKDSIENSQFLGAVVAYERPRDSKITGRLRSLDIVDGQQRLLTLYIFMLAIAERIHFYDKEAASEIIQEFLLLPQRRGLNVNTRLVPSFKDRSQFRAIWDRINTPEHLKDTLKENPPIPPLPSGNSSGNLTKQYSRIIAWLKRTSPSEPQAVIDYLQETLSIITRDLTFVHLKLTDAVVATKIFERLNFRGVKVGIVDLVRNEIFSRISQNPEESLNTYETEWRPFEAQFEEREDGFFFPYTLIYNSTVKKSELFSELRVIWKDLTPGEIIGQMKPYQKTYLDIVLGNPSYESIKLNQQIKNLHAIRVPSATYPFVMKITYEIQASNLSLKKGIKLLEFLESFLVRRAILGYEPTGLHAIFKGVWNEIESNPSVDNLKSEILNRSTIQYPNNREVINAVKTRALYKARITPYLLREYDKSIEGDTPSDEFTMEHIMPNSWIEGDKWSKIISKEKHSELKDTLSNLIPLSGELNKNVQRDIYSKKRTRFKKESMFITPRDLAEKWEEWNEQTIKERAEIISTWITKRWKE
ncbi:DUF262 domain-containing HNH endonuclease family protein [Muricauda sp. 2012CJ35-5]|uniref:DUF262 domain-containing HNH endonuclease family protein n=1 Tax=Flagellimonas spongiicola TaxID=2942208 RepID=A0ABT0PPI1_9FLAO|nr:DUF262 domain-containing protein [Allomuricauda spongiicola]MCL6273297.1 DUF262 domain-containing HNH endonuclease family protein [Allomuricauda spongiicola]